MLKVDMSVDWGGRPLQELERLMEKRAEQLGESGRTIVWATARHVLRSLKADTRKARLKARDSDYTIEDTGWTASWTRSGGCIRRAVRDKAGNRMADIYPIWRIPPEHKGVSHVYRITPKYGARKWVQTRHKGCWYVCSASVAVARKCAKDLITKYVLKRRGLAVSAIIAATKAARIAAGGFESEALERLDGSSYGTNIIEYAQQMAWARFHQGVALRGNSKSGSTWVLEIHDDLSYAQHAFKHGTSAVDWAMAKAANSIAGMLRKRTGDLLDPSLATPFPEIAQHRRIV